MYTISQAMIAYLDSVALARSENTARSYGNAIKFFSQVLDDHGINIEERSIKDLQEDAISWLATALKDYTSIAHTTTN